MAKLQLQNLSHQFGNIRALNQLSLQVDSGKILTLLGPSGCGKTTTILLIAGLLKPSSGKIIIDEQDITSLPPEKRNIGMVFQSYALFPHLNVFENVAFGDLDQPDILESSQIFSKLRRLENNWL